MDELLRYMKALLPNSARGSVTGPALFTVLPGVGMPPKSAEHLTAPFAGSAAEPLSVVRCTSLLAGT
jgi:hypothetical protein